MESDPCERVLCCNVLQQEDYAGVTLKRLPLFAHLNEVKWPPCGALDAHCWHCCHPMPAGQLPVPLPAFYDVKRGTYHVQGIFCSWSCARGHLDEHCSWKKGEQALMLVEMARECFGYEEERIVPAPSRFLLKMFGGDMNIDEFRHQSSICWPTRLNPPLITVPEAYEFKPLTSAVGDGIAKRQQQLNWTARGLRSKKVDDTTSISANIELRKVSSPFFEKFVERKEQSARISGTQDVAPSSGTLVNFMRKK